MCSFVHTSVCLSACPSGCLSAHSTIYASSKQSVKKSNKQSIMPSGPTGQTTDPSICQSAYMSTYPSFDVSISQSCNNLLALSIQQLSKSVAQMKLHKVHCFVCRQRPRSTAQHTQHSTHGLSVSKQHASIAAQASWPQVWPGNHEQNAKLPTGEQYCKHALGYALHGQASAHELAQHSAAGGFLQQQGKGASGGAPGGVHRGGDGLSTVRGDTPSQQSCRPSSQHDHGCMDGTRQKPKRPASDPQRRLYKHGPVVPKSSAMQRPIRRRQRPDWDDHLTSVASQTGRGGATVPQTGRGGNTVSGEGQGSFSPRPTAKELLQEALARIQTASSPRPQHSKRQRRGTAPQQRQPGSASGQASQLQNSQSSAGGAQLGSGHSCGADATAAQGYCPGWDTEQQPVLTVHPNKQSLVKQPPFGRKPSWVCRSSADVMVGKYGSAVQNAGGSMHLILFLCSGITIIVTMT